MNYDFIASLGEMCACAKLLSKLFIRQEAGPFDWICGISFTRRIQLILKDFPDFLNEKHLQKSEGTNPDENYDVYVHQLYGTRFLHDFPRGKNLLQSLPTVQDRYKRRIARFQNHLRTGKVLLIFITKTSHDKSILLKGMEELNEMNSTNQISLLYMEHNPALSMTETIEKTIGKNLYYVQLNNSATNSSVAWQGNIPMISDIMCRYCRGISYKEYLTKVNSLKIKFAFGLVRFCSCGIPFGKWRKRIRQYIFSQIVRYNIH